VKYDPDIHHRRSIRRRDFDYSSTGAYFVTICTQGRECLFGSICNGVLTLNEAGRMVAEIWTTLSDRFPNIMIDTFTVMPNHFHGIVMLYDRRSESCIRPITMDDHIQGDHKDRPYGTAADSVGRIVQAFKSLTTNAYIRGVKEAHWPSFPGRFWQRNYYERIIRNEEEMATIREYIASNPIKWTEDKENPDCP